MNISMKNEQDENKNYSVISIFKMGWGLGSINLQLIMSRLR